MARKAAAKTAQSNIPELTKDQELDAYRDMLLIRRFEEKAGQMYGMGLIGGFCHLYIGQEAVVTGVTMATEKGKDAQITGYRDHGHMLVMGLDPKGVMAELTGRQGGLSKGKGGSMHMFSNEHRFYGGNGIVGAQVSLGTGLAFAASIAATTPSRSPISATARPTRARSTRASTWPSSGTCRSSTSSKTTATPWAPRSSAPRRRRDFSQARPLLRHRWRAGRRHGRPHDPTTPPSAPSSTPAAARVRTSSKC